MAGKNGARNPVGRPSTFFPEYIDLARDVCAATGATDKELAKLFECTLKRLVKWKQAQPLFRQAIKEGKDEFDSDRIEASLKRRATGYEFDEIKEETSKDGPKRTVTTKHYAPEVGAMAFWLKNRRPDRWRDKRNLEVEGGGVTLKVVTNVPRKTYEDTEEDASG